MEKKIGFKDNGFVTCTEETSSKDTKKGVLAVDLTTEM